LTLSTSLRLHAHHASQKPPGSWTFLDLNKSAGEAHSWSNWYEAASQDAVIFSRPNAAEKQRRWLCRPPGHFVVCWLTIRGEGKTKKKVNGQDFAC
jgi:hypothetical protein